MLWRRRREEEEKEKPGIQNQKQEPHTKMWGKTHALMRWEILLTRPTWNYISHPRGTGPHLILCHAASYCVMLCRKSGGQIGRHSGNEREHRALQGWCFVIWDRIQFFLRQNCYFLFNFVRSCYISFLPDVLRASWKCFCGALLTGRFAGDVGLVHGPKHRTSSNPCERQGRNWFCNVSGARFAPRSADLMETRKQLAWEVQEAGPPSSAEAWNRRQKNIVAARH